MRKTTAKVGIPVDLSAITPSELDQLKERAHEARERMEPRLREQREHLAGQRERIDTAARTRRARSKHERTMDARSRVAAQIRESGAQLSQTEAERLVGEAMRDSRHRRGEE